METILLIVTCLSISLAVFAFTSAHRARRRERERSEARIAALSAAADTPVSDEGSWADTSEEWYAQDTAAATEVRANVRTNHDPLILNHQAPVTGAPERFFGTVQREETAGGRLPLLAAAALIVIVGGALIFLNSGTSNDRVGTTAQVAQAEPLELVALGHARDPRQLTISGTIRNPSNGSKLEGLTAVVSLLDRDGAFLSTKDVPLDYRALAPGEEAPFKVSIPEPGSIARYRVSFRAGADVVPHVDRRSDTKLASSL